MNNREAQNELCRSTNTPEEKYKNVSSYERGDKYANSYVSTTTGRGIWSSPSGGGIKNKEESVGIIRRGCQNSRPSAAQVPSEQGYLQGKQAKNRGRGAVNLIQEQDDGPLDYADTPDDGSKQHGKSVGWVNRPALPARSHSWDSDSSGENVVMAIRSKISTELKVAGTHFSVKINGKTTHVWIDSGSPISIFIVGE